ncbi:HEAT repeat domain-containing protein [Methylobacterium radiodurans]|uniref:HEAT repeat domain-containing protein n=1 Tax=Methylobacterium radiodurans TaxID=2202828 RepID=A0A2U8VV57_9HYPH|nr:HEAT repeat domain-containing protein [Methylobacterium radiodurans]AWN37659.1 hypothetical protein DK427_19605 [Methylobacterium radiodurans]
MTRPIPDNLETKTGSYFLWTFLPILPPGDPRWERCSFVAGRSTADGRGHGASWEVKDGRLYLKRFGGAVPADDPHHQYRKFLDGAPEGKIQVGMPDVHETDEPIFATWVTADLNCASWERLDRSSGHDLPRAFRLFRIERGHVVAQAAVDNRIHRAETEFRGAKAVLDAEAAEGGAQETGNKCVPGLAEALADVGDAADLRPLARLLWRVGRPDLAELMAGFVTSSDADVRRWIAYALGRIGTDAAPAVPMLTEALETTQNTGGLEAVAYALASIGLPAASTLPTMIAAIEARCGLNANRQILLLVDQLHAAGEGSIRALIDGLLVAQGGSTQYRIAHALGQLGSVAVLPLANAFVAAGTDTQRAALARALGLVGRDASPAVPLLLGGLERLQVDEDRAIFAEALKTIGLRSNTSLPRLRTAFQSARGQHALRQIAGAIASLGPDAVDALVEEFEAADGAVARTELARAMGELGPAAIRAVACLAEAAENSSDGTLVGEVADALRKIGAPADLLATIQTAALKHGRSGYGTDGILTTMRPGIVPSPEAICDLVDMLVTHGMDPSGRHLTTLLGAMGAAAVEPLLAALGQAGEPRARYAIINALGRIGPPAEAALDTAVRELAAAQEDSVRLQLVDDIRRIGRPGPEHLNDLLDVMRCSTFLPIWWRLGIVLADMGEPAVAPLLKLLKETQDNGRRRAVANALSQFGIAN